jgi:hypothetical protein
MSPNTTPSAPKASARSGGEVSDFEPVVCMSRTGAAKEGAKCNAAATRAMRYAVPDSLRFR